jgi:hypothetical protein
VDVADHQAGLCPEELMHRLWSVLRDAADRVVGGDRLGIQVVADQQPRLPRRRAQPEPAR